MRLLRRLLFWTHLVIGVAAGALVFIMAVTGVLLTYQKQMTVWADLRGLDGAPPAAGQLALPADTLLSRVAASQHATPTAIVWRSGASTPVELQFGREKRVFANAYTAEVVGTGSVGMRGFFRQVTDWHRWLAAKGERRDLGRAATGAANLAFLAIVLSGIWLWWPRNLTWASVRSVTWFRRGLSGKARDFNWHNVIGFWSAIPLVIVVASGVVISYPWASALVFRVAGEAPPGRTAAGPSPAGPSPSERSAGEGRSGGPSGALPGSLQPRLAVAKSQMPDWRTITLTLPTKPNADASFALDRGMGGEPHKRATAVITTDGHVAELQSFATQTPGRRLRSILRFAHTGEVLGAFGQTIAGLISLGSALLVFTGIALSLRRLSAWLRRRSTPALQ
ncbi:PepSY-associated TM helix domain-containing protein [Gemmatimonas groenlandica]|uniref:PepSY domain-containing protein n=1 Tax=Gemmatimonas groenlandica TaxID=2732249 RepID=A0A6M4IVP3_9BACT|nr:PepSY-associated TM helix domain-containing protein [Gemmatimonas groenlandica]QJR37809.1 PepSY domain-containing protein [Gemmatimonas groenlandica]